MSIDQPTDRPTDRQTDRQIDRQVNYLSGNTVDIFSVTASLSQHINSHITWCTEACLIRLSIYKLDELWVGYWFD